MIGMQSKLMPVCVVQIIPNGNRVWRVRCVVAGEDSSDDKGKFPRIYGDRASPLSPWSAIFIQCVHNRHLCAGVVSWGMQIRVRQRQHMCRSGTTAVLIRPALDQVFVSL